MVMLFSTLDLNLCNEQAKKVDDYNFDDGDDDGDASEKR